MLEVSKNCFHLQLLATMHVEALAVVHAPGHYTLATEMLVSAHPVEPVAEVAGALHVELGVPDTVRTVGGLTDGLGGIRMVARPRSVEQHFEYVQKHLLELAAVERAGEAWAGVAPADVESVASVALAGLELVELADVDSAASVALADVESVALVAVADVDSVGSVAAVYAHVGEHVEEHVMAVSYAATGAGRSGSVDVRAGLYLETTAQLLVAGKTNPHL